MRRFSFLVVALVCASALPSASQSPQPYELNAQGVGLYNAGRYSEAIDAFERAYEWVPDNATVRRNLCNAHQAAANELARANDFAAAAKHLEVAIGVEPDNASPLVQLGSYYLRLEMVADAIYRLEEAIEYDPGNVTAHDLLGDAYYMDNDIPSARIQWEWVAKVEPNRPGIHAKLEKSSREASVEGGFRPSGSKHFNLSYDPDVNVKLVRQIRAILERAYGDIGRNLGGAFPPAPVPVILYKADGFADATLAGEHVGGLYDGKIRIPVTDKTGATVNEDLLRYTLYHEYTHVVVRFLTQNNVPWWLNEGLAETLSLKELSPERLSLLQDAAEEGLLLSFSDLEASQLGKRDDASLRLAYAQSQAAVRYLWTKFGQRRMAEMLSSLASGKEPEECLRLSYNRSYDTLFKESLRAVGVAAARTTRK